MLPPRNLFGTQWGQGIEHNFGDNVASLEGDGDEGGVEGGSR